MNTTTLRRIELRCPNCGNEFTSQTAEAPHVADPARRTQTDFRMEPSGIELLHYGVHQCSRCGFAGREDRFSASGEASYEVQRRVWDELAPRVLGGAALMSEKYACAAKVASWDGADSLNVADLWLRAAWCAVDEGDTEAERFYRVHAARSFEDGLETYDAVGKDDRTRTMYLVGELWRRIGDAERATRWFARVIEEAWNPRDQKWVHWAKRQNTSPADWFI